MFTINELEQSAGVIHQLFNPTQQYNWPLLSQRTGCEVWVKHENHTPTTAFKVRGGIVLLHSINQSKAQPKGLISATRGNHGQSLSYAGKRMGMPVTIVVPESNSLDQNDCIRGHGANLIIHGKDFEAARAHALGLQQEYDYRVVAAFERDLVLGVATYALELFSQLKDLDTVYVPVGMGSGIVGLIKTRDLLGLKTKIVGVVSEGASAWKLSFNAGRVITTADAITIADGIATSAPPEEAFEVVKDGADRVISVNDDQIAAAMYHYYTDTHNLAEGAAAAPLAGLITEQASMKGKKVGLILSGGNIDFSRFAQYVKPFDAVR